LRKTALLTEDAVPDMLDQLPINATSPAYLAEVAIIHLF
jgi:hypothetical protein